MHVISPSLRRFGTSKLVDSSLDDRGSSDSPERVVMNSASRRR